MAGGRNPTTDFGTVILHWLLVGAFLALLLTGMRIAADDPGYAWLAALDAILPMEHLWWRHLAGGFVLAAALAGYFGYIVKARLKPRVRIDRARLLSVVRGGEPALAALGVLSLWLLLVSLLVLTATGVALFLGSAGAALRLHLSATWTALGAVFLHVALHAAKGGVRQLTRIVRPARLVVPEPSPDFAELLADHLRRDVDRREGETSPASKRAGQTLSVHPFSVAIILAIAVGAGAIELESATREELRIREVRSADAPKLDGDLSDPVWRLAPVAIIVTAHGGDFGGRGESQVEVRAVHDGEFVYFAFVWEDPTRSLKHLPLVKGEDGWRVARNVGKARGTRERLELYEDKFAVLLSRPLSLPLIGAAIHLSRRPLPGKPAGRGARGLHYTDGGIADVWQWRSSHEGSGGFIENCHFAGPSEPVVGAPRHGEAPYTGGFHHDEGEKAWLDNVAGEADSEKGTVLPLRLPRDLGAIAKALGRISGDVRESESEDARWWMSEGESEPYSSKADDRLPLGTIIPGTIMLENVEVRRSSIRGRARWAAGRWTLELARRLYTGSPLDLPIKTGTLLWVAAFDHSEARHTRHLRPVRMEVE